MKDIEKSEVANLEREFLHELAVGIDGLAKAGAALVKLLNADPEARTRLIAEHDIPRNTIATLEKIGNKLLLPALALDPRFRFLPMTEQKRIVEGKVEVFVQKADGESDTLLVNLMEAPSEIKAQVLNGDHIRPPAEQRAWLIAKNNQKQASAEVETVPWRTYGRKQVEIIKAHTVLNRSDLLSMMKAIEG